jgi:hypothetical protein
MTEKETTGEKEEEKQNFPKGFYVAEVPTNIQRIVAFEGKEVYADELLVRIANACKEAGILKE